MLRRNYLLPLLILSVFIAPIIAMMIVVPALDAPEEDIRLMFIFMSGTGSVTVGLSYLLYHRGDMQRFNSLRWTLLATIVLTFVLIFVNVWLTAQLMFISSHDLILTTVLLLFAGFVSIIAVFFVSSTLIERIHALAQAAERLARGDLNTRLPNQGNDELARLATTFNMMADALQAVDEQKRLLEQTRRDLIAWVSHDLRTPLAAIRAMNEAILDNVVTDPQTVTRYLQNTEKEIQHLSKLIDDLFSLAQLDTRRLDIVREMTSLRDLISDTLGSMGAQAMNKGVTLSGQVEDDIDMIAIAPDKIQRVLYNLLDNAIYHTPAGGQVTLSALQADGAVEISVANTGSMIAPDDLPHIFESFYRAERSRTRSDDGYRGTGLGLAIARGFIEAHGGKIWVESQPGQDTKFIFTLPQT